jgi:hypothetical protein
MLHENEEYVFFSQNENISKKSLFSLNEVYEIFQESGVTTRPTLKLCEEGTKEKKIDTVCFSDLGKLNLLMVVRF